MEPKSGQLGGIVVLIVYKRLETDINKILSYVWKVFSAKRGKRIRLQFSIDEFLLQEVHKTFVDGGKGKRIIDASAEPLEVWLGTRGR
jgi:hypothetical protein